MIFHELFHCNARKLKIDNEMTFSFFQFTEFGNLSAVFSYVLPLLVTQTIHRLLGNVFDRSSIIHNRSLILSMMSKTVKLPDDRYLNYQFVLVILFTERAYCVGLKNRISSTPLFRFLIIIWIIIYLLCVISISLKKPH